MSTHLFLLGWCEAGEVAIYTLLVLLGEHLLC
jgi:hypothetical protein